MNKQTIIGGIILTTVTLASLATTAITTYKSVQISTEAKDKVLEYSKQLKLSQRDTVSKIVLDYKIPLLKRTVTWAQNDINSTTVQLNLIRKVSYNPIKYDYIRAIAGGTDNDGSYEWTPLPTDFEPFTYIEISCVNSIEECRALPLMELK